jgi:hypothetical protein
MTEKIIVSEDIFMKAAIRAHERIRGESLCVEQFPMYARAARDEMSNLCEKILALKDVGAL